MIPFFCKNKKQEKVVELRTPPGIEEVLRPLHLVYPQGSVSGALSCQTQLEVHGLNLREKKTLTSK